MRAALARFVGHSLRIRVRLCHNFLIALLCFSEFLSDLLRVELTFFNFSPAIFEHGQNRLVSELAKQNHDDAKANNLGQKKFPLPTERIGGVAESLWKNHRREGRGQGYEIYIPRTRAIPPSFASPY